MTPERKEAIARQLAEKRQVMGDSGFSSFLNKVEAEIPKAREQRIATSTQINVDNAPKGVLGFLSRITGVERMGTALGSSINTATGGLKGITDATSTASDIEANLVKLIREQKAQGKDTFRLERALEEQRANTSALQGAIPSLATGGVTNREVVGSAIRTAGTVLGAGQFGGTGATTGKLSQVVAPQLTSATTMGTGALQGLGQGALAGLKSGATFGAVSGLATGIEENKGVLGTAFEMAKQGAVGGVTGAAVGGAVGTIGGAVQAKANRRNELQQLLSQADDVDTALKTPIAQADDVTETVTQPQNLKTTSRQRAGFVVSEGKVKADPKAQRLLKQGVPDRDVAIMQSFSPEDTKAAKEMVKIAKEVSDTGLATRRQQEVVGKAFMRRAKDIELLNKQAGAQIDDVARKQLSGVRVNASAATDDFFNQLERAGVDVDTLRLAKTQDDIAQAFAGSDFEGLGTVQKTLKTVLNRVDDNLSGADMDGLQLHRVKRFIDNQVTYGKNAEGLTGDAERLLKVLRANIDDVLDGQFPDYNKANTQYRDTITAIDEMRRIIGKDYLGSQDIANLRAGEVMNRLLGNASARPLSALQNLENTAAKYGKTYNDSILKQITFADLLDDVYETVPARGMQGTIEGGVRNATTFMERMRQGGLISATIDTAGDVAKSAVGVTPEARQKAIEDFLGLLAENSNK